MITNVVSSHLWSTYRDYPMEAATRGDRISNRKMGPPLTSTTLLVRSLNTAESLMTNWVIVQSIISFLHPSRSERASAGVNSLIGETRSLRRTIRENSGINWVWLRELFNGTQLFLQDIIGGQMGRVVVAVGWCLLAPVFCGCVCVTVRQIKVINVCSSTKYKQHSFLSLWVIIILLLISSNNTLISKGTL